MDNAHHRPRVFDIVRRGCVVAVVIALGVFTAPNGTAQMLARPGWQGSGLTTEMWWRRPVVYEIDARSFAAANPDGITGLKGIVEHLDYLRSLGVDAILLDPLDPTRVADASQAAEAAAPNAAAMSATDAKLHGTTVPIDPALGTLDDFDTLSLEASRRNIRVLLNLAWSSDDATTLAAARFWLNRGVAGFHLVTAAGHTASPASLAALRQLLRSFYGGRILIGDVDSIPQPSAVEAGSTPGTIAGSHSRNGRTRAAQGDAASAGSASSSMSPSSPSSSSPQQLALLSSLLGIPSGLSRASTDSQQQAAIAVATKLHGALEQALSLPANQLPLLVMDGPSVPPSIERFGDVLGRTTVGQAESLAASPQGVADQRQIAKLVATVLLGTRAAALVDQGQEISQEIGLAVAPEAHTTGASDDAKPNRSMALPWQPLPAPTGRPLRAAANAASATKATQPAPDTVATEDADPASLLNFYRQLSQLHHGNTAMRDGETILLDHSAQGVVAWVRRPKTPSLLTPAIVVLMNLSAAPTTLSLKAELTKLQLRGSFLRTVLRSDTGMGSMNLTSMTLPPYTVYIGELRY